LSHAALNSLAVIEGNGGPMAVGALGARMHITSGSTTSVLDTLERNGYVVRLTDRDDRRRVLVEVTPSAQEVLDKLLPEVVHATTAALVNFTPEQLHAFLETLADVRSALHAVPGDLGTPAPRRKPSRIRRSTEGPT